MFVTSGQANAAFSSDIALSIDASNEQPYIAHSLRAEGFDASEDGTGRGTPLVPVAYRTSPNCGAWETGDRIDALTTATDPNSHVLAFTCKDHGSDAGDISPTLRGMGHDGSHANAGGQVAVALRGREGGATAELSDVPSALRASRGGGDKAHVMDGMSVRRLTPRECERLQGFPDDYTLIPAYAKRVAKDVEEETLRYIMRGNPGMTEEQGRRWASHPDGPRYKALGNSMAVPVLKWIGDRIKMVETL